MRQDEVGNMIGKILPHPYMSGLTYKVHVFSDPLDPARSEHVRHSDKIIVCKRPFVVIVFQE